MWHVLYQIWVIGKTIIQWITEKPLTESEELWMQCQVQSSMVQSIPDSSYCRDCSTSAIILVTKLSPRAVYFIQKKQQCLKCILYTFKEVLTKYNSLKFNALSTHLLNKQIVFFDKNVSIVLLFCIYNCPIILYITTQQHVRTYLTQYNF